MEPPAGRRVLWEFDTSFQDPVTIIIVMFGVGEFRLWYITSTDGQCDPESSDCCASTRIWGFPEKPYRNPHVENSPHNHNPWVTTVVDLRPTPRKKDQPSLPTYSSSTHGHSHTPCAHTHTHAQQFGVCLLTAVFASRAPAKVFPQPIHARLHMHMHAHHPPRTRNTLCPRPDALGALKTILQSRVNV